jgi:hypothetical protein
MSDLLKSVANIATGGLASAVSNLVMKYAPPEMSPEQKAQMALDATRLELDRDKATNDAVRDAEAAINERIKLYEGTATELAQLPVLGPIMVFLRAAQRPIMGYATMFLDYMVFSGAWKLTAGTQENCFWFINALVLTFLFGERAIKNVSPFITDMLQAKRGG